MRVIAGSAKGRRLAEFSGRAIRPTPDRVREALFSILYSRGGLAAGGKVVDLFAGSGALGIEALSRGAAEGWFVDSSRDAVATIRENLNRCSFSDKARILARDVWEALPLLADASPFDVIFADPPYGRDHASRLLEAIDRYRLLGKRGILCLETAASDPVPRQAGAIQLQDQRRYGLTMLHFYQHSAVEAPA
ncbi:MAG: 16S rRNA (guanine(966)-N(2))-methyltransferase RsmD [Deltaproteobacteria bacterium]|nr:MAG: 16S rRNA (guanine(966)-N(2))-methyltransferase RsmD [Deltaproteobacteria bacterium]